MDENTRQGMFERAADLVRRGMSPQNAMDRARQEMSDRSINRYEYLPSPTWIVDEPLSPPRPSGPPASYTKAREAVEDYILEVTDKLGWDAVIGNDEAKLALQETIEASTLHPEIYAFYSMKPPRGALLYGPPGCGKTMYAKATASAIARMGKKGKAEMILINGPAIQTPYVGQTEKIITALFTYAKEYFAYHKQQLVIFFDEADSLFPDRERSYGYEKSQVATFLAEMDGVATDNSAFVLLASNRPDAIDPACLRDGRCDRKIKVQRPTLEAMLHILADSAKHVPIHGELDWAQIVDNLVDPRHRVGDYDFINLKTGVEAKGYINLAHIISGALVVGLVDKAKSFAFRRDIASGQTTGLTSDDFTQAIEQIVRDNSGLTHTYALQEIMESLPKEEVKFKGTLN